MEHPTFFPVDLTSQVVGWSGSRQFDGRSPAWRPLARALDDLRASGNHPAGFVTGGCIGIDHFIGARAFTLFPEAEHLVIVPANRSRVKAWWRSYEDAPGVNLTVVEMPVGTDYAARNWRIVRASTVLVGAPQYAEADPRSTRSGTWQTIRMARRAPHQPVVIERVLEEANQWL